MNRKWSLWLNAALFTLWLWLSAHALSAQAPTGLQIGDIAPPIEAADQSGRPVSLAALLKQGPVIVTFYRGHWCPFCNRYLKQLQDSVAAQGGRIIAITPESREYALKAAEKTGATYPIVSDADGRLLTAYRVGFTVDAATLDKYKGNGIDLRANHGGRTELPVPATYLVGRDGRIRFVHFDQNYRNRARLRDLDTQQP